MLNSKNIKQYNVFNAYFICDYGLFIIKYWFYILLTTITVKHPLDYYSLRGLTVFSLI